MKRTLCALLALAMCLMVLPPARAEAHTNPPTTVELTEGSPQGPLDYQFEESMASDISISGKGTIKGLLRVNSQYNNGAGRGPVTVVFAAGSDVHIVAVSGQTSDNIAYDGSINLSVRGDKVVVEPGAKVTVDGQIGLGESGVEGSLLVDGTLTVDKSVISENVTVQNGGKLVLQSTLYLLGSQKINIDKNSSIVIDAKGNPALGFSGDAQSITAEQTANLNEIARKFVPDPSCHFGEYPYREDGRDVISYVLLDENDRPVTSLSLTADRVTLNTPTLSLFVGDTSDLNARALGNRSLTWSSNNEAVATVNNGKVTAVAEGTATITATSETGATAECVVTVSPISVTSVKLNSPTLELYEDRGEAATLIPTILPENAADKTLRWTSSDTAVATVDQIGNVTVVGLGTTTITATAVSGVSASCVITVKPKAPDDVPVTGVTLNKSTLDLVLDINDTYQLTADVQPADATDKKLSWTSSDETVVTVVDGLVTAVGPGTATITVTTVTGSRTASCTVTVAAAPQPEPTPPPAPPAPDDTYRPGWTGSYTPPTPTYAITVEEAAHGSVSVNRKTAAAGDTVTLTVTADSGFVLETLSAVDGRGNSLPLTDRGDGKYAFTMPGRAVTISASFTALPPEPGPEPDPEPAPWVSPYPDVAEGAWYYDAVRFVTEENLMTGHDSGAFGPGNPLTRAQLVQILYNHAGRPGGAAPQAYSDVAEDAWYAPAAAWAWEQEIARGYGGGQFGPDDTITREQLAVMLWRYAGCPAAADSALPFADGDSASSYALEALAWAVEEGVISGTENGALDPRGFATRAQTAQMLKNLLEAGLV